MSKKKKTTLLKIKSLSGKIFYANKYTLSFEDRALEEEYTVYLFRKSFAVFRNISFIASLWFIVVEVMFKVFDYFDSKNNPYAYYLQLPGVIWGQVSFISTYWLESHPKGPLYMDIMMAVSCFIYVDYTLVINSIINQYLGARIPATLEWIAVMSYALALSFRRKLVPTMISPTFTVVFDTVVCFSYLDWSVTYMICNRIPCLGTVMLSVFMSTWLNEFTTRRSFLNEKEFENWKLDMRDIDLQMLIGKGTYGEVYKGTCKGYTVAVKKIIAKVDQAIEIKKKDITKESVVNKSSTDTTTASNLTRRVESFTSKLRHRSQIKQLKKSEEKQYDVFEKEVRIMCSLRHPNIVTFMGAVLEKTNMVLVTEFCEKGSLFHILVNMEYKPISLSRKLDFALGSAYGLRYLHGQNPPVIHRDFKSLNILLDANFNVKVCDFGLSEFVSNMEDEENENEKEEKGKQDRKVIGTVPWLAPEIFSAAPHSVESDIFSFAIVLWEIFSERHPYLHELESRKVKIENLADMILKNNLRPNTKHLNHKGIYTPESMIETITACWNKDPEKRLKWQDIISIMEDLKNKNTSGRVSESSVVPRQSPHIITDVHKQTSELDDQPLDEIKEKLSELIQNSIYKSRIINSSFKAINSQQI